MRVVVNEGVGGGVRDAECVGDGVGGGVGDSDTDRDRVMDALCDGVMVWVRVGGGVGERETDRDLETDPETEMVAVGVMVCVVGRSSLQKDGGLPSHRSVGPVLDMFAPLACPARVS